MTLREPISLGCAHGRFQILHNDHLAYLEASLARCDFLFIGLTSYDIRTISDAGARSHRSFRRNNPLTFYERFQMISVALCKSGYPRDRFAVVPFPIETPERLRDFVPDDAVCFTTIREPWNQQKVDLLRQHGYSVEVLWTDFEKPLTGTRVRDMIASEEKEWRALVPSAIHDLVPKWNLPSRLRALKTDC